MRRRRAVELARVAALCACVVSLWFLVYKQSPLRLFGDPIMYAAGDDTFVYAIVKAVSDGEIGLFGTKQVRQLGAPFVANWNDYPWTEDVLFWLPGQLAKLTGITRALNLAYVSALLLAACSFYAVGRYMRWRWQWCFAGAALYAWSYYMTHRAMSHYNMIFYGSAPVWLLVCWWAASRRGIPLWTARFWIGVAAAFCTGWNNPYYTLLLLQLLGLAIVTRFVRRHPPAGAIGPVLIAALCVALVLSMHLDTFAYQQAHGPNPAATIRYMHEVELYGLRLIDLFLPFYHRWQALEAFTREYGSRSALNGELFATYLGLAGCLALVWMFASLAFTAMQAGSQRFSGLSLQGLWIAAYATVGSLNMVPALFSFHLFRSMNRASVLLLALALLHGAQQLTRRTSRWPARLTLPIAAVIIAIGLWDQTPVYRRETAEQYAAKMAADRRLGSYLEDRLPKRAMIFQLPVMRFPDSHPYHAMGGYDHLRPYLFSNTLHFSHGDNSGRATEEWRDQIAFMPIAEMTRQLERHGFRALLIDREGYSDRATDLMEQLGSLGYVADQRTDGPFALVRLHAAQAPVQPRLPPHFQSGWHERERNGGDAWRWSSGRSWLVVRRPTIDTLVSEVRFDLHSPRPRRVTVSHAGQSIAKILLDSDADREAVTLRIDWSTAPNPYALELASDQPSWMPDGDRRLISFRVINVTQTPPVFDRE